MACACTEKLREEPLWMSNDSREGNFSLPSPPSRGTLVDVELDRYETETTIAEKLGVSQQTVSNARESLSNSTKLSKIGHSSRGTLVDLSDVVVTTTCRLM